ncbi:MAG: DsbA family protein [Anaerolineae bacterium]
MAKSSSRLSSRYKRRRRSQRAAKWLPWAVGGAVVLIVVLLVGQSFVEPKSPGEGYRSAEWFEGVVGLSYDNGATDLAYPDPAALGEGRQWLPALGEPDAPIVMMEFSDIFCGHCRDYSLHSLPDIIADYVATGKVRYVDHYFGFAHTVQQGIVHAEMCAAEQGRYFEFKHALFQTIEAGSFNLERAARVADLDMSGFQTCQDDQRYVDAVQEMAFVDNNGVRATPTFFINGEEMSGNVPNQIRDKIDAILGE